MLDEHYTPYSQKRISMTIEVLKNYKIDITNSNSIDLLIEEAKYAQKQSDYLTPLKKPLKTLFATILPIVVFVAQKIGDATTQDEMVGLSIQAIVLIILGFSLFFALTPVIKNLFYRDYNRYEDLIYDLRQIKLFYSKEISTTLVKNATSKR